MLRMTRQVVIERDRDGGPIRGFQAFACVTFLRHELINRDQVDRVAQRVQVRSETRRPGRSAQFLCGRGRHAKAMIDERQPMAAQMGEHGAPHSAGAAVKRSIQDDAPTASSCGCPFCRAGHGERLQPSFRLRDPVCIAAKKREQPVAADGRVEQRDAGTANRSDVTTRGRQHVMPDGQQSASPAQRSPRGASIHGCNVHRQAVRSAIRRASATVSAGSAKTFSRESVRNEWCANARW